MEQQINKRKPTEILISENDNSKNLEKEEKILELNEKNDISQIEEEKKQEGDTIKWSEIAKKFDMLAIQSEKDRIEKEKEKVESYKKSLENQLKQNHMKLLQEKQEETLREKNEIQKKVEKINEEKYEELLSKEKMSRKVKEMMEENVRNKRTILDERKKKDREEGKNYINEFLKMRMKLMRRQDWKSK